MMHKRSALHTRAGIRNTRDSSNTRFVDNILRAGSSGVIHDLRRQREGPALDLIPAIVDQLPMDKS